MYVFSEWPEMVDVDLNRLMHAFTGFYYINKFYVHVIWFAVVPIPVYSG